MPAPNPRLKKKESGRGFVSRKKIAVAEVEDPITLLVGEPDMAEPDTAAGAISGLRDRVVFRSNGIPVAPVVRPARVAAAIVGPIPAILPGKERKSIRKRYRKRYGRTRRKWPGPVAW